MTAVLPRLVVVREALECGDVDLAYQVVVDLEEDLRSGSGGERLRVHCGGCGRGFAWPGLLDHHQLSGACPARREAA